MAARQSLPWVRILAEGSVIVLSILLALAADAWWQTTQERAEERALLSELRSALQEDLIEIRLARDTIAAVAGRLERMGDRLESGELRDSGLEYQREVRALGRFTQVLVRYGPFETLKGRGLSLISNPELRVSLTSLFEDELPRLQSNVAIDRALSRDRVLPFQLEHFVLTGDNEWQVRPGVDEQELRERGMTLARYRHGTLVIFYLPSFERSITQMSDLIEQIDRELGSGQ